MFSRLANQAIMYVPSKLRSDMAVIVLSLLTGIIVWYSHGQTFSSSDLRKIWLVNQGHFAPATAAWLTMLFFNLISTLYLWLFCRIAAVVGLGKVTIFLLFMLINFNPEYNSVRFDLSWAHGVILLWVASMWLFLSNQRQHFYRAFVLWFVCLLIAAVIEPAVWLWIVGFPLCFLFWPGSGRIIRRIKDRVLFIAGFYALCALLIWIFPFYHDSVMSSLSLLAERIEQATSAMSVFISEDRRFSLAGYDAFIIAWVLVLINAAKNLGFIILMVLILAIIKRPSAVLPGRVWLFFAFSIGYASIIGALSLLYLGHLQSDLLYLPVTMLVL